MHNGVIVGATRPLSKRPAGDVTVGTILWRELIGMAERNACRANLCEVDVGSNLLVSAV